jgi:tripartite-type tricarboxylate transporter receptor subunit TctC
LSLRPECRGIRTQHVPYKGSGPAMQELTGRQLEELGLVGVASTPADFAKFIEQDIEFQTRVMKLAKLEKQ